ncbi:hypothetical protein [Rhodococcus sovatensis]|uniref:Fenitrothion hydrolase n=1 Tax=Rhodococcus sovatensis TaxID=1805840 RepID=A0ABZ2PTR9_9NOCA
MILAHGLGGSTDLPIPATYVLIGGAWALSISFAVLMFAWRTPRLDPSHRWVTVSQRIVGVVDAAPVRLALRMVVLAFAVYVTGAAVAGPNDSTNVLPGVFYVLLWVGLPVVSILFGPVWRIVSPLRTLRLGVCSVLGRPSSRGLLEYPERLGCWPVVLGLFAFVWLELAYGDPGSLTAIRLWCSAYVAIMVIGSIMFGDRWFECADPFEKFSDTVATMAVLARSGDRSLVLRNPLDGLRTLPVLPGTVAVVAVLLGSTAFDSASQIPAWRNLVDSMASTNAGATVWRTGGLILLISFVGLSFWLACRATGGVSKSARAQLPGALAHSLVPIAVGYVLAHYFTYLVEKGQGTVILLADPLDHGWNLVGQQGWEVSYALSEHPGWVAAIKVMCVLTGHVLGVVAAHDASLRLLPAGHRLTGQLALMVLMVFFTFGGLFLLFGG